MDINFIDYDRGFIAKDSEGANLGMSLQKKSFCAYISQTGAAGVYSQIQLWNPAASGVLLELKKVSNIWCGGDDYLIMGSHNVEMPNNTNSKSNKYLGEAAPSARIAKVASGTFYTTLSFLCVKTQVLDKLDFIPPIIIPQGMGLSIMASTVNLTLLGNFHWNEISIPA